ncbi:MAG: ATP-binding protein [Acidimicrobiia bacterium]
MVRRLYPRGVIERILEALSDTPVVAVNGARQVGKSTLMGQLRDAGVNAEILSLDDSAQRRLAVADPDGFVERRAPTLVIDEVQLVPELMRAVKASVDRDRRPGRFVLTGSTRLLATPGITESLAGRMEVIELWPLSQGELASRPERFVDACFGGIDAVAASSDLTKDDYIERLCAGGFPEAERRRGSRRGAWFEAYATSVVERVVNEVADVRRQGEIPQLVRLCAARTGQELNVAAMGSELGLPARTTSAYLAHLATVFLVSLHPAWATNLSAKVVRKPKVVMVDSGLAAHLLRADPASLRQPDAPLGPLMETFVLGELRRQMSWAPSWPSLSHFRDRQGYEVDAVLEGPGARVVGLEVKASTAVSSRDFRGLRLLAERLGPRFVAGIVLYTGRQTVPASDRLAAMPISALWS